MRSRGRPLLALGIVLCAAGAIGFVVFLVSMLVGSFAGMQRLDVPGRRTLALDPGDYTAYWESEGWMTGVRPPELRLAVRPAGGGPERLATAPLVRSKYSTGSRVGVAVLAFSVDAADRYELDASAPGYSVAVRGVLQVGRSFGVLRLVLTVVGSLAILGAGLGAGIPLIIRSVRC